MRKSWLVAAFLAISAAHAIDVERLDDPALQQRYERLTRELRCLVCQAQHEKTHAHEGAPRM